MLLRSLLTSLERISIPRSPEIIASAISATVIRTSAWRRMCLGISRASRSKTACAILLHGSKNRLRTIGLTKCAKNSPREVWLSEGGREVQRHYILITGGAGFIGTNIARQYLLAGQPVHIFDNLSRAGVEENVL